MVKYKKNHIHDKLQYEYKKCILGLEEIIKEGWIVATHSEKIGNTKDKISSLNLSKIPITLKWIY